MSGSISRQVSTRGSVLQASLNSTGGMPRQRHGTVDKLVKYVTGGVLLEQR